MKATHILLALVLLFIAVPSFAFCSACDWNCNCAWGEGSGTRCKFDEDCCHDVFYNCYQSNAVPTLFAGQYIIASVEVTTPVKKTVTVERTRVAEVPRRTEVPRPR